MAYAIQTADGRFLDVHRGIGKGLGGIAGGDHTKSKFPKKEAVRGMISLTFACKEIQLVEQTMQLMKTRWMQNKICKMPSSTCVAK